MASKKIRVLVLFGGRSSEHEVSILSAASIIAALDSGRYEAIPVAIERSGRWLEPAAAAQLLPPETARKCSLAQVTVSHQAGCSAGFDVIFPALHGSYGEDGRLQGLLDMAGLPYVGSGVLGSACGMDKDVMKRLFRAGGIPTLPHETVLRGEASASIRRIEQGPGYPAFVKPANLGSSVGIRRVEGRQSLIDALHYAHEFDTKAIVERGMEVREIECAVIGNRSPEASLPGEIVTRGGFYDYKAKYVTDSAELIAPAELDTGQVEAVRDLAVAAFRSVGCAGLARVDFFIARNAGRPEILVNEVNTMPGFTSISMFPRLWAVSGLPYQRLIEKLIDLALERHAEAGALRFDAGQEDVVTN